MAATKGEPNGIAGEVVTSEGVDALCCACGVNKLEIEACCGAGAAARCSAAACEKGESCVAGWADMPNGDPLLLPPNENGEPACAETAASAGGWEEFPKGDPPVAGPNENGDPTAGKGACCPSENGLAGACGSAAGKGGAPPPDDAAANGLKGNA